jgi:hypothetical protein
METAKQAYEHEWAAEIAAWRARLDALKARAADVRAHPELALELRELAMLEGSARQYLAELERSTAHPWPKVQAELDERWGHLAAAIERLLAIAASETTAEA